MLTCPVFALWTRIAPLPGAASLLSTSPRIGFTLTVSFNRRRTRGVFSNRSSGQNDAVSGVRYDSLRVLEWDKVCDLVASFAATLPGREAVREQLWDLGRTYDDSLRLLRETDAAVEMHNHGGCRLFFTGIQLHLVEVAVRCARSGLPVGGEEAVAVAAVLDVVEAMQVNLKAAVRKGEKWYNRFMPLSEVIMELPTNKELARKIRQVIDEDGTVKDSASSALQRARNQVSVLENKLNQLMDSLIRKQVTDTSSLAVSNVRGRWCIKSGDGQRMGIDGLLLSSDSGKGSILEPLMAVPLNDELQHARATVIKAEKEVLLMLTEKMQEDLDDIEEVSKKIVQLDVINARATYSLSFGGANPALYLPEDQQRVSDANNELLGNRSSDESLSEWILYMPKANHPLLLYQHRTNLRNSQKAANNANTVAAEIAPPVPVDFSVAQKTKVLIITGPNTGGKTICLKTIGLAAMMAKSGLYVLSTESVRMPWFDSIFADIGDEQSLSQSLSTFSGHLKQISNIRSQSTRQSLVLLDEVGAGTNPLEGAALGMAVLESFAVSGALLTIATTHHGELKSLKYSNDAFENACMEFDEANLKPTYKILWGVPGRSNAINISERLGLPSSVVSHARELYGAASAELNEVIVDMERFKQDYQELLYESKHYLMMSRTLYDKLLKTRQKLLDYRAALGYRKAEKLAEAASKASSIFYKKVGEFRASAREAAEAKKEERRQSLVRDNQSITSNNNKHPVTRLSTMETSKQSTSGRHSQNTTTNNGKHPVPRHSSMEFSKQSTSASRKSKFPKVGESVEIASLRMRGTVLSIDPSKEEIFVQAGIMKMKLKLADILT